MKKQPSKLALGPSSSMMGYSPIALIFPIYFTPFDQRDFFCNDLTPPNWEVRSGDFATNIVASMSSPLNPCKPKNFNLVLGPVG